MVTLYLARWETRFWAWLIDIILVGLPVWALSDRLPPSWEFTVSPGGAHLDQPLLGGFLPLLDAL
ncbi:hypothetical protein [Methanoculleus chikugoensis]|uniref:hypothetical protein n=1 Tax=Methanoculleus chikugoensis TaxID=118126 RepID=UPI000A8FE6EC|nr:hypothetical protein [Methanoculleus chikugoensis]